MKEAKITLFQSFVAEGLTSNRHPWATQAHILTEILYFGAMFNIRRPFPDTFRLVLGLIFVPTPHKTLLRRVPLSSARRVEAEPEEKRDLQGALHTHSHSTLAPRQLLHRRQTSSRPAAVHVPILIRTIPDQIPTRTCTVSRRHTRFVPLKYTNRTALRPCPNRPCRPTVRCATRLHVLNSLCDALKPKDARRHAAPAALSVAHQAARHGAAHGAGPRPGLGDAAADGGNRVRGGRRVHPAGRVAAPRAAARVGPSHTGAGVRDAG